MLSHVQLSCNPMDHSHQAPLSTGFPRQEYWSGLPFPPPGDLPNPGIKPTFLVSPALAGKFFTTTPPGNPKSYFTRAKYFYNTTSQAACGGKFFILSCLFPINVITDKNVHKIIRSYEHSRNTFGMNFCQRNNLVTKKP